MLCFFGFLREIRPSEPFVTDYMIYPWRNITSEMVNRYVFPIGTYSYAAQLVIVFLITDFLKYKPLIILSGISGIIVWAILIWTKTLRELQITQIFYGTYMATEVAYYTYIYAKVEKQHYLKVTSHTRAAILTGKFVASSLGQILVTTEAMDYRQLNFITFGAQIASAVWAVFLPKVKSSLYFHRNSNSNDDLMNDSADVEKKKTNKNRFREAFRLLWTHFRCAYSNVDILVWSLWYSAAMCGYLQVISYIQVLWTEIDNSQEVIWNGAVEAVITLLGAGVALLAGYLHSTKLNQQRSLFALMFLAACEGSAIFLASSTPHRVVSYIGYMIFCVLYSFTITVASAEVAKHLEDDSFGLVFGINTFVAVLLQTILTLTVVSDEGLALTVFQQYTVYAVYFFVLSAIYLAAFIFSLVRSCRLNSTKDDSVQSANGNDL